MERDLRTLYKKTRDQKQKMPEGHLQEFEQLLAANFSKKTKRNTFVYWSVAASLIILVSLVFNPFESKTDDTASGIKEQYISLGSLSPELEKVESFYTKGVQLQWATIKANYSNSELLEVTESRMNQLDGNYQVLTEELNEQGPSEDLINAMIENLELRMRLLIQLKGRLNELNKTKDENKVKSL